MASIEVKFPLTGATVPVTFTANGTYTGNPDTITCSMMIGPMILATGAVTTPGTGAGPWEATFTTVPAGPGYTLIARISDPPPR